MMDLEHKSMSLTASGLSYDDTGVSTGSPKKASTTAIKSLDDSVVCSSIPVTFNTPVNNKPLTDRTIKPSPEGFTEHLDKVFSNYRENGLAPETTPMLHRFGLLGLIIDDHPGLARYLLTERLSALKEDTSKWWSSTKSALNDIAVMEQLLDKGDMNTLMHKLYDYERQNNKVPFHIVISEKFTDQGSTREPELFKPFKSLGFLDSACANTGADQRAANAKMVAADYATELKDGFTRLPPQKNKSFSSTSELVDVMVLAHPEMVHDYLLSQNQTDLQNMRVASRDLSKPLDKHERVRFETCVRQLQELNNLTNRAELKQFLENPENSQLNASLQKNLADAYLQQLKEKIETADYDATNQAQLHEMEGTFTTFNLIVATCKSLHRNDAGKTKALTELDTHINAFKRVTRLCRIINQQKNLPESEQLFVLKAPRTSRLVKKLTKGAKDTETRLYEMLEIYESAASQFHSTGKHDALKAMQQARFDLLRLQQNQVESEILAKLADRSDDVVMTSGDYAKDVETLKAIYGIRQKVVPVRPANDQQEGVYRLAKQTFWRDERIFTDILADLHQAKTLKNLDYSMGSEVSSMIRDVALLDSKSLTSAAKNIAAPTQAVIDDWKQGKGSIWQTLNLPGNTYKVMETEARHVIQSVLDVAEQNPARFRHFFGDVSLVIDQLKCLVGSEGSGLIDQLQHAAAAQSAASYLAGDTPVLTDVDPNSDLAKNIRRFRCLCDIAEYSLHGGVLLNVISNYFNGCAGIIGGAVGGFIAGPVGATVGYAAGNVLTAGNAAARAAGTYAIRGSLNGMTGNQIRILDKVVNYYGPSLMSATLPYNLMASTLRNFGKGDSLPTATARSVLKPVLTPFNAIWSAIQGIRHSEGGAWKSLAIEMTTVCSVAALTAATGGLTFTTGALAILGSPALGAAVTAIATSYGLFRLIANIRNVGGALYSTVKEYQESLFDSNNPLVQDVREACTKEAKSLAIQMQEYEWFHQAVQEQKAKILYNLYWKQWSDDNTTKATSIAHGIADQLKDKEQARRKLAAQVLNTVQAITALEKAINEAATLAQSDARMNDLHAQLQKFGIKSRGFVTRTTLAQALQSLKEEQLSMIKAQCGTAAPGNTEDEIFATLTRHYREVILGGQMVDIAELSDEQVEAAETVARQVVLNDAEKTAAQYMEEQTKRMITASITKAVESQLATGKPLTKEALENPSVINAALAELESQTKAAIDSKEAQARWREDNLREAVEGDLLKDTKPVPNTVPVSGKSVSTAPPNRETYKSPLSESIRKHANPNYLKRSFLPVS